uniref:Guanine nucleotide-binding protein alpha-3 subunit n=1 Tax=Panagrellus redivivus TaxID=6233 RepID=A0A7E4UL69_PANRE
MEHGTAFRRPQAAAPATIPSRRLFGLQVKPAGSRKTDGESKDFGWLLFIRFVLRVEIVAHGNATPTRIVSLQKSVLSPDIVTSRLFTIFGMGVCQSQEEKDLQAKTKQIDKELIQGHAASSKVVKLLLLGAGESGKSTLLKQMRILHDHGFSDEEMQKQKSVVYNNTVQGMAAILRGMNVLTIPFGNPAVEADSRIVLDVIKRNEESEPIPQDVAGALERLWNDKGVQDAVHRGNEYQLPESAPHFLANVARIAEKDYKPTEQDILLSRIKTTGIVEVKFKMKNVDFRVFDVGGQRSERKKWIHCFEDVNAIIFIAALSEYDQVLFEDESTNRMVESMRLFESICNSRWFINTSMILFLNKKDLFMEKIKKTSIKIAFSEYKGSNSYDEQVKYVEEKFESLNANPDKTIYMHQTCATDTNQVQMILDSVIDMIIQANLQGCGLY